MCRIDPVKCPLDAWTRGWRTRRTVPSTTRTMYVIICTRVGLQAPGARCPTTPCPRRFGDGSLFIRHDQFFLTTHLFIRFSDSSSVFCPFSSLPRVIGRSRATGPCTVARHYDMLATHRPWQWYLERAAKTSLRFSCGTSVIDSTVFREVSIGAYIGILYSDQFTTCMVKGY